MKQNKAQGDGNWSDLNGALKVRLHLVTVQGVTYHVITPFTSLEARYSAKFYHRGWHLKFHQVSAWLLSCLMWGLSHEMKPNTVVFLGPEFVDEVSDPILMTMPELTLLDVKRFGELFERMEGWNYSSHRPKTIHWETRNLEEEILELGAYQMPWLESIQRENSQLRVPDKMIQCGGMACYFVPAPLLRDMARLLLAGRDITYLGVQTEFKISRHILPLQLRDPRQAAFEQEKWQRYVNRLGSEMPGVSEENPDTTSEESHHANSKRTKVDRRRQNGKCTFPSPSL